MTEMKVTADVFYTAFRPMRPKDRAAFIARLATDLAKAEDLRYAAMIEEREGEPTISLDDYIARRTAKK